MDNKLNICQWNIRGFTMNKLFLEHIIQEKYISIFALQETYLDEDKDINFKNYELFRKDRNVNGGGVMLRVHKSINCQRLNINTDLEVVAIEIFFGSNSLKIFNIYVPPLNNSFIGHLDEALKQIGDTCP